MPVVARAGGLAALGDDRTDQLKPLVGARKMVKIWLGDRHLRRRLGPTSTFDATIGWWYFGPPLSAMLSFTSPSGPKVMAAIAQYSNGRFPIHSRPQ